MYDDFECEHSLATVLHPCLEVFRTGCHARFLDRLFSRLVVGVADHRQLRCAREKFAQEHPDPHQCFRRRVLCVDLGLARRERHNLHLL